MTTPWTFLKLDDEYYAAWELMKGLAAKNGLEIRFLPLTDRTPHAFEVRNDYALAGRAVGGNATKRYSRRAAAFDAWLNEERAKAWDEGGYAEFVTDSPTGPKNPYKGGPAKAE